MSDDLVDQLLDAAKAIGRGDIPPYQHCETYTTGAFDLLLVHKRGGDAFDLLSAVCQRYGEVKEDQRHLKGYFYLLGQLVRQSETTELPKGMEMIITENPGLAHDLQEWYRTSG